MTGWPTTHLPRDPDGHRCGIEPLGACHYDGWGEAIERCYEATDGTLWVENDEYATRVNFCPFCGASARCKRDDYAEHAPTQPGIGGPSSGPGSLRGETEPSPAEER